MIAKKDITAIIGDNESFDDFCNELNRRSAVLDFLALYAVAKEKDIVQRVKHIIHATGFSQFKPKHWEMYITRLFGRCLRHIFSGYQQVEKQRNSFIYTINMNYGEEYAQYGQILGIRKMVELDWPWYVYGHGMERYRNDSQLYWRTRGLADPSDVDAMFAAWNQFLARSDRYDRCQMQGNTLHVNYGSSAYGHYGHTNIVRPGTYNAHEAFLHTQGWMVEADQFLEDYNAIFDTYRLLESHTRDADNGIEREIRETEGEAVDIARERAEALALQREQEAAMADAAGEQEERVLSLGESLMENLREKGLIT